MFDFLFESLLRGLVFLVLAIIVAIPLAVLWSIWLDRRLASGNTRFAARFRAMQNDPRALADYYGRRWIGICIFFGLAVASFVFLR